MDQSKKKVQVGWWWNKKIYILMAAEWEEAQKV